MSFTQKHPWRFTIGAWGAFILAAILFLLFDYNGYTVLGFFNCCDNSNNWEHDLLAL